MTCRLCTIFIRIGNVTLHVTATSYPWVATNLYSCEEGGGGGG